MLVKKIELVTGNLTPGTIQYIAIEDKEVAIKLGNKFYSPTSIRVVNNSGDAIEIVPISSIEKTAYDSDSTITDLIPVANSDQLILNNISNSISEVSGILYKGTGAGNTGSAFIYVIQE